MDRLWFRKTVQFSKLNASTGEFVGLMTSETPDEDREVMDFEQSRPYFEEWSQGAHKISSGKSYGNVREMHGLSAAGKLTRPLIFNTKAKQVFVHGMIVDPVALRKANEGVYVGLSIGGRYVDRWPDPDRPGITRYVADPNEVSLVDSPNNPDAVMELIGPTGSSKVIKIGRPTVTVIGELGDLDDTDRRLLKAAAHLVADRVLPVAKASRHTKRVGGKDLPSTMFAFVGDPARPETWKYAIHDAMHVRNALARWGQESVPAEEKRAVYARIKDAAQGFGVAVSADVEKLVKSLYDVGGVAQALQNLEYIRSCLDREEEIEQDGSPVPAKLRDTMAALGDVLKELVVEETDELLAMSAKEE